MGTVAMIEDKLQLNDEDYWSDPWRTRKSVQRSLMQKGEEGFVIGTPSLVALNMHNSFPVALLRVRKLLSTNPVNFRGSAIIAAMELNTSQLRAKLAFDPPRQSNKRGESPTGGEGDSFSNDQSAMIAEGDTLDLAQRLNIPATRGNHIVTLICLDQVSNQCRMKLVESSGYQDPAVDDFLRTYQSEEHSSPTVFPQPGTPMPRYQRVSESTTLPDGVGIAMEVTRVNPISQSTSCILQGSYRLPVRPHQLVSSPRGDEAARANPMTAVVPITLLLTGSVDATPKLLPLSLPSYGPTKTLDDDTIVTGYFALDLCHMTDLTAVAQTYFIYAFSGEVMEGPVPTAFVRIPRDWEAGRARLPTGKTASDAPMIEEKSSVL